MNSGYAKIYNSPPNKSILVYLALFGATVEVILGLLGVGSFLSGGVGCVFVMTVPTGVGAAAGYIWGRNGQSDFETMKAGASAGALAGLFGGSINTILIYFKVFSLASWLEYIESAIWIALMFGLFFWILLSMLSGALGGFISGYFFHSAPPQKHQWTPGSIKSSKTSGTSSRNSTYKTKRSYPQKFDSISGERSSRRTKPPRR